MIDPIAYYNLESYLLREVRSRFTVDKSIGAFDFFSIIVWKSNRSKSLVAHRLLRKFRGKSLEQISRSVSRSIHGATSDKERLRILLEDYGFKIAIASAILAILYPNDFTIYDYRASGQVKEGEDLKNRSNFEELWSGYVKFRSKVSKVTQGKDFREKDRFLFGQSRIDDLSADLKSNFRTKK